MSCASPHSTCGGAAAGASQESACKRRRLVVETPDHDRKDSLMTPNSCCRPTDDAFSELSAQPCQMPSDAKADGHPSRSDGIRAPLAEHALVIGDAWHLVAERSDSRCAARLAMCSRGSMLLGLMPGDPVGHVAEYAADAFKKMRNEHARFVPSCDYMGSQPELNAKMRAILVDWLLDVHRSVGKRFESLCMAVNCVDRYLSRTIVSKKTLQLVGAVALMLAFKVEESYQRRSFIEQHSLALPVRHLPDSVTLAFTEHKCDGAYSRAEVAAMECSILSVLECQVSVPTVANFLSHLESADGCSAAQRLHTRFLAEFALIDYDMIKFSPLHIAASVLLLSNRTFERKPEWSTKVANLTGMMPDVFLQCQQDLLDARFPLAYLWKHGKGKGWKPFPGHGLFRQFGTGRELASLFDASVAVLVPLVQKSTCELPPTARTAFSIGRASSDILRRQIAIQ